MNKMFHDLATVIFSDIKRGKEGQIGALCCNVVFFNFLAQERQISQTNITANPQSGIRVVAIDFGGKIIIVHGVSENHLVIQNIAQKLGYNPSNPMCATVYHNYKLIE